jgi:hypothetical protein
MLINVPEKFDHNHEAIVEMYKTWREKLLDCGIDEQFITLRTNDINYGSTVRFRGTLDIVKWNDRFSLMCYLKKCTLKRMEIIVRNIEFKVLESDDEGVYVAYSRRYLFAPIPPRVMRLCERIAKVIELRLQDFCYNMAQDFKRPIQKAISDCKAERKNLRLHFHDKLFSEKEREAVREKTDVDTYLSSVDLIVPQNLWRNILDKLAGSERRALDNHELKNFYRFSDGAVISHIRWSRIEWLEGDDTYEAMKVLMRIVRTTCPCYQYVRLGEEYDDFENELKGWADGPLVVTRNIKMTEEWDDMLSL